MKKQIKLMAEYGGEAVWWMGHRVGPTDLQDIPISDELRYDIKRWARSYADTLDDNDPAASDFDNDETRVIFDSEGSILWKHLQEELGSEWEVHYYSERQQELLLPASVIDRSARKQKAIRYFVNFLIIGGGGIGLCLLGATLVRPVNDLGTIYWLRFVLGSVSILLGSLGILIAIPLPAIVVRTLCASHNISADH
ncbi:hypothetical protein HED60_05460 [Planctomycetales bacterium ZRK34]|nr:hypothetical protein HED60_05460 [Planctomycetales bacterium ZRK34]